MVLLLGGRRGGRGVVSSNLTYLVYKSPACRSRVALQSAGVISSGYRFDFTSINKLLEINQQNPAKLGQNRDPVQRFILSFILSQLSHSLLEH